ncbi:translation initiation factor IF-2 [Gammaproteobacteria bacterium]|jgi:translation initiation factor IF-2|nr:translation initiation factor IF-2 [Gammaproteobacteria bacterium]MDA9184965.1 translation initiation factor IF-2 [Gammaproteobacteria bacterium]MDB2483059.1 translation initiation factor IF-2 [Gammaproteobacteria bacterium]MDB4165324.1 translation initiation factor IF-2 [Gammaproteobacteria bacterium]MDB9981629.1 translation initiation factor IF-2 [Gammaproteobacteria bacterium]
MADVTISELAKVVGVDVDKLLSQVKDAGLPHKKADEIISNDDKNTLLQSLRGSHGEGEGAAAPSKITLKRKTLGTLKSASSSGRGKTVNVEVRKKRTYVKRTEVEEEVVPEEPVAVEPAIVTPDPVVAAEAAIAAAAEAAKATADEPAPAAPSAPAAAPFVPDVPSEEAASARADKPGAKRKPATKKEIDDEAEKKRTQARTTKGKPAKRQNRTLHVNDAFVLEGGDSEGRRRGGRRGRNRLSGSTQAFEMPTEAVVRDIKIGEANKVTDLAQQMTVKAAAVVKALFKMGVMANINHVVDADTATLLVEEMGHRPNFVSEDALEEQLAESLAAEIGEEKITRAPVVTVMGHVDHGKTSLLDYIRKSTVASHEAGGITQHIGAYHVDTDHGMVSFLDTPGHAAFSAMRSRGAKATDVIVLVVAGDDGVKPQTAEAVQHAKAAGVPLVVAINKMDKEGADPDRVKNELAAMEVIPDDWGGDTQFIPVSAHTGDGVDKLLEAILLQAELMELTAYTDVPGQGVVVESRLDKGRGAVASVLVQNGTLRTGDIVLVGKEYGRVRALVDENGVNIKSAGPSIPVEILGLTGVPDAGDEFVVLADEKKAKEVAEFRRTRLKDSVQAMQQAALIDNMFAGIGKPNLSIFNIILKTDVRGTLEALTASLVAMNTDEVQVKVVSSGVGGISENDVHLAATSKAMIVGFNVRADKTSKEIIDNEGLQLRYYNVIYNVLDDVKAIMGGMLSPEIREEILGVAEVRDVFTSPKFGQIAGSMVIEGTIHRNKPIRVLRDDVVIYEGELESLRRFKDDANEVKNGVECGIGVKNYTDVRVGDKIEVYKTTEIARTL